MMHLNFLHEIVIDSRQASPDNSEPYFFFMVF